jgi:hypothetical protein
VKPVSSEVGRSHCRGEDHQYLIARLIIGAMAFPSGITSIGAIVFCVF